MKKFLSLFLVALVIASQQTIVVAETQECENPDMIDPKCPTRVRLQKQ